MNNWRDRPWWGHGAGSIGVFDSGVGGLTVLRALQAQLPQESFLYFGDTARLPYGIRSEAEILQYVREILTWMTGQGIKMAVMACNTSSALALDTVRSEFPIPIIGLILPAAQTAVKLGRRIGVIATPATVGSGSYPLALQETEPTIAVAQSACPMFVPLVESNRLEDHYTRAMARQYLDPLLDFGLDTLIYGCTHYPHLSRVITECLPKDVQQVDPALSVAIATGRELDLLSLRNHHSSFGQVQFYVSGNPRKFAGLATQWLGYRPRVKQIPLRVLRSQGLKRMAHIPRSMAAQGNRVPTEGVKIS
ncbi:glutamate racemase [Candidatus Synechococcus calcipolaris G9]|uniref:Glutamate racemase n=1 Tax=Candidatus Synechococcus calcipolaris G9 TaxID=1497997 RepID=A0ABT6F0S1_9SYNE|nr:glutamate racemase [Candidatus Synechococcus calcipolaris]MDG2991427.1 glutamate racemase [Candidatus Synechococcus calcipolaris G9]